MHRADSDGRSCKERRIAEDIALLAVTAPSRMRIAESTGIHELYVSVYRRGPIGGRCSVRLLGRVYFFCPKGVVWR